MFWCLVRLSTGALCGGLYANPLEMAIQSAVACSEAKDDGLLVSCQLMERVQVWVPVSHVAQYCCRQGPSNAVVACVSCCKLLLHCCCCELSPGAGFYPCPTMFRLRTGHSRRNAHMYSKLKAGESEMCPCNADILTAEHLLLHCQLHDALRRDIVQKRYHRETSSMATWGSWGGQLLW